MFRVESFRVLDSVSCSASNLQLAALATELEA